MTSESQDKDALEVVTSLMRCTNRLVSATGLVERQFWWIDRFGGVTGLMD